MLFYVRDRTNSALKKHVGFVQKESMITNAIGNKMHSISNQGSKETVQNGPIDKRVNDTSASITKNDAVINDVLKESLTKVASIQKTRDPTLEISSKVALSTNAVHELPILQLNGGEQLTKSPTIKGSDKTVNNALGATTDCKSSDCNKERCTKEDNTDWVVEPPNAQVLVTNKDQSILNSKAPMGNDTSTKKDMSDSIIIAPELNGHQSSAGDSCITEMTPEKVMRVIYYPFHISLASGFTTPFFAIFGNCIHSHFPLVMLIYNVALLFVHFVHSCKGNLFVNYKKGVQNSVPLS